MNLSLLRFDGGEVTCIYKKCRCLLLLIIIVVVVAELEHTKLSLVFPNLECTTFRAGTCLFVLWFKSRFLPGGVCNFGMLAQKSYQVLFLYAPETILILRSVH